MSERLTYRVLALNCGTPHEIHLSRAKAQVKIDEMVDACLETGGDLMIQEGLGWVFRRRRTHYLIRDTSTESRANLAAYISKDHGVRRYAWRDGVETWRRTSGITRRQHPARSFLAIVTEDGVKEINAHQAPVTRYHDTEAAQKEGARILANMMKTVPADRPAWIIGDFNASGTKGYVRTPDLAKMVGGTLADRNHIDTAIYKDCQLLSLRHPTSLNGVQFIIDHHHVTEAVFRLAPVGRLAPVPHDATTQPEETP